MPKGTFFRLVVIFRPTNQLVEAVSKAHPNLDQAAEGSERASCFAALSLLQDFRRCLR